MSQNVGITKLAYARTWHHIPLYPSPIPLGRLASRISLLLQGKHKPIWNPSTDCGDYVVATHCGAVHITGRKRKQKMYYSHTTRPGSLRKLAFEGMVAKWGGGEVLRRAVRGMLPKNRLRDVRMGRLKVFEGPEHPYKQNLVKFNDQRQVNVAKAKVPEKADSPPRTQSSSEMRPSRASKSTSSSAPALASQLSKMSL